MCSHLVSTREGFYRGGRISSALLSLDRIYRIETKGHPEVPLNLEHIEPGHNITRAVATPLGQRPREYGTGVVRKKVGNEDQARF